MQTTEPPHLLLFTFKPLMFPLMSHFSVSISDFSPARKPPSDLHKLNTHECTLAHSFTVVTAHESHTTKHRWVLERDIVVGSQEWYRQEAKFTVQSYHHCSCSKSVLRLVSEKPLLNSFHFPRSKSASVFYLCVLAHRNRVSVL